MLALGTLAACAGQDREPGEHASPERRAEVAARGARVMPFDLTRTTHAFTSTGEGGVQTVTANDPGDTLQVRLIREHLRRESDRFARGDFDDPMAIHGHQMPGLAELRTAGGKVRVEYSEIPAGARIRYRTSDPGLREALHRWFAAQRRDHGV
jgi:hypothetical protein